MENNEMKHNGFIEESKLPPELKGAIKQMKETKPFVTGYPWPEMEIGDSILFQADKGESIQAIRRKIGGSAYHYGKMSGKKFATKIFAEENAVRVWRIE